MTAPIGFYDGIGGSMCAAILGMDKNKTPYDAWLNFTDPSTRENLDDNEPVLWGQLLELPIGEEAARRLGIEVVHQPALIKHPSIAVMQAHVDFLVVGQPALLECKARGLHMLKQYDLTTEELEDGERVLDTEAIQVHHYLTVTGFEYAYLAVLIGGQRLLTFKIKRDPDICRMIEEACVKFWRHVETGEPPPPINIADCHRLWPSQRVGSFMEADEVLYSQIEQRKRLKKTIKDAEHELEYVEFRIKSAVRDVEEVRWMGKKVLSWKVQDRTGFELERFREENPALAAEFTNTGKVRVMR